MHTDACSEEENKKKPPWSILTLEIITRLGKFKRDITELYNSVKGLVAVTLHTLFIFVGDSNC